MERWTWWLSDRLGLAGLPVLSNMLLTTPDPSCSFSNPNIQQSLSARSTSMSQPSPRCRRLRTRRGLRNSTRGGGPLRAVQSSGTIVLGGDLSNQWQRTNAKRKSGRLGEAGRVVEQRVHAVLAEGQEQRGVVEQLHVDHPTAEEMIGKSAICPPCMKRSRLFSG